MRWNATPNPGETVGLKMRHYFSHENLAITILMNARNDL